MRPQCITKTCPQTGLECLPRWRKSGGLLKCEFTSYKFIQTACRLPTFEGAVAASRSCRALVRFMTAVRLDPRQSAVRGTSVRGHREVTRSVLRFPDGPTKSFVCIVTPNASNKLRGQ